MSHDDASELSLASLEGHLRVVEVDPDRLAAWRAAMETPGTGSTHMRARLGDGVLDVITTSETDDAFGRLVREIARAGADRPEWPAYAAFLARAGARDLGPGPGGAFLEIDGDDLFGRDRLLDLLVPGQEDALEAVVVDATDVLDAGLEPIDRAYWIERIRDALRARSRDDAPAIATAHLDAWIAEADRAIEGFLRAVEPLAARGAALLAIRTWPSDG